MPDWRNACMLLTMYHQKTLYNKHCLHEAKYITCVITKSFYWSLHYQVS